MRQRIDLSKMDFVELKDLRKSIDKAIASAEKTSRKKALDDIKRTAKSHGFDLGELVEGQPKRVKAKPKTPPKYRNPSNASETWSGRGRQPEWFKSAIEGGTPAEQMII